MLMGLLGIVAKGVGLISKVDKSPTAQKLLSGLDHLNLTEEEKVEYALEQAKLRAQEDENSVRAVVRRLLAIIIIGSIFTWIWLAVIFWWINKDFSDYILNILKLDLVFYSGTSVTIFYFGYYGLKKGIEAWKAKK